MFESVFEFLFKYRPLVFQEGDFTLHATWAVYMFATLVAGAAAIFTLRTYARARGRSRRIDRAVLAGLRLTALAVILFCLVRPVLVLTSVVPQQNFLGILIDDSRSMQIADRDGETRSAFVQKSFGSPESPLFAALADRFALRFFRFSSSTERFEQLDDLSFSGTQTHLGQALERAQEELAGVPLSGLVMITDGADNAQVALAEALLPLQASAVPVFTVGLGREEFTRDIQLSRIETPRSVLKGTSLVVDVVVVQTGYRGSTVSLNVEDEGRIVSSESVELPADGEPTTVRMRFTASEPGPRIFRFRIPPQPGEMVTQNNVRDALIVVEDRREKILYFEGEPRWEVGFLLRAVEDDENLQVVLLQRTAENKFLRLNLDDPQEVAGGFPKTREELFKYRGLILGSVEAGYFTPDQLRMIADFVSQRGGGLLTLGGKRAFAQGGYAGTPVADVLPVVVESSAADSEESFFVELKVQPTRSGTTHPATQIADSEEASADRWEDLPAISVVNPITEVKPGATTLLTGDAENLSDELVVLAYQRYGAGKSLAFPVQDSWLWQMHADVPVEDETHETFWRRLLRWLVDGVPDQVAAQVPRDRVEPGQAVEVLAQVDDPNYLEINNSHVVALVTDPLGDLVEVPMEWTVERDGEYKGRFVPDAEGLYGVRVEASRDGMPLGSDVVYIQSAASESEYYDAGMRAPLLRRIAEETGGRFYTPETVSSLPEDISYVGSGVTVVEERPLWDMPVLLLVLAGLVLGEWSYRRARGLA